MLFTCRTRRPPKDPCNSLRSFAYTLLTNICVAGLEAVGLDPFIGVLHTEKSGKPSLALDMMEELRPVIADRFVINTTSTAEKKRLGVIVKELLKNGVRIQESVFECELNAAQFREFYEKLLTLADQDKDSIRFYIMGNKYKGKIRAIGNDYNGTR